MFVEIEFISSSALKKENDTVGYILNSIHEGKIVVLEEPLAPEHEKTLIAKTMGKIDGRFAGIEVSTLRRSGTGLREKLFEMLGARLGITVIGPAKLVKEVKQNPEKISWKTR